MTKETREKIAEPVRLDGMFEDIAHECKSCGAKWNVNMLLVGDSYLTLPTYIGSDTYLCPKCKSENTIVFRGKKEAK